MASRGKNPVLVEAGRRGARRRWGPARTVDLRDLTGPEREFVLAVIELAMVEARRKSERDGDHPAAA